MLFAIAPQQCGPHASLALVEKLDFGGEVYSHILSALVSAATIYSASHVLWATTGHCLSRYCDRAPFTSFIMPVIECLIVWPVAMRLSTC